MIDRVATWKMSIMITGYLVKGRKVTVYQHYFDMIDNWFIIIINNQLRVMERICLSSQLLHPINIRCSETLFSENVDTLFWTQALFSCYHRQDLRREL